MNDSYCIVTLIVPLIRLIQSTVSSVTVLLPLTLSHLPLLPLTLSPLIVLTHNLS